MKAIRCAIYTRKSSEEGLEQDFNSLDAQREACAAYVKSQSSEGWSLVKDQYDDGGKSGGTMVRLGLQRLLADIAIGKIDVVVVYKVDRLTRSLLDFSRLVEAFDKAESSFVSVTQSFNTTTSMGRLTLNMLLSFAQFEREVTAERIRDKIAASKAKGMWMGGTPPLGYRADGRSLAIVEEHAALVRHLFERYVELRNVRLLAEELGAQGVRTPRRTTLKGRMFGGLPFFRGQIYKLLSAKTYIGMVEHAGQTYLGTHPAIIDQALWDAVQTILAQNLQGKRTAARATDASLLAGLLVDDRGVPMVATHACKGKVRYRYYVSRDLQQSGDAANAEGWRLPAREIEPLVRAKLVNALRNPLGMLSPAALEGLSPDELPRLVKQATALAGLVAVRSKKADAVMRELVKQVRLQRDTIDLMVAADVLSTRLGVAASKNSQPIHLTIAARLKRTGKAVRLVTSNGVASNGGVDRTLLRAIVRGRDWWQELCSQPSLTLQAIGRREKLSGGYVLRLVRLAFLDPAVLATILDGTAPAHISVDRLSGAGIVAPRWAEQRSALHFPNI